MELIFATLVVTILSQVAVARVCTTKDHYGSWFVQNAENITAFFQDCTTIKGYIHIMPNFAGSFILPNVTAIDGTIVANFNSTFWRINAPGVLPPKAEITSIEAPDLLTLALLEVDAVPMLTKLSLPKLQSISSWRSRLSNVSSVVELQSLERASYLYFGGEYTDINLSALHEANSIQIQSLSIDSLSFPSLRTVKDMWVSGAFKSLSVPNFTATNGTSGSFNSSGLRIEPWGPPVPLEFPKLDHVYNKLSLRGNISSISMPQLKHVQTECRIEPNTAINISLPLREVETIWLGGHLGSATFPNLTSKTEVIVDSNSQNFDCDVLEESIPGDSSSSVSCGTTEPQNGLSQSGKIAVGVVVPIVVIGLLLAIFFFMRRRMNSKVPSAPFTELRSVSSRQNGKDVLSPPSHAR